MPRYATGLVAIGNNVLRYSLDDRLLQAGLSLATVVHPKAMVSPRAQLDAGFAVIAGTFVGTERVRVFLRSWRIGSNMLVVFIDFLCKTHALCEDG